MGRETGGGQWYSIRTSPNDNVARGTGPNTWSEGCSVVMGEKTWDDNYWPLLGRAKGTDQGNAQGKPNGQ